MTVAELLEHLKDCDPTHLVCVDTTGFTTSGIYPIADAAVYRGPVPVPPDGERCLVVVLAPSKWP